LKDRQHPHTVRIVDDSRAVVEGRLLDEPGPTASAPSSTHCGPSIFFKADIRGSHAFIQQRLLQRELDDESDIP